ncbi:MAG: hypothetical protein J2P54_19860 [Bradyrhizobiaceae bacterium]|nr:hypothetical protein [Bradyrhizobiaceae bacterium]
MWYITIAPGSADVPVGAVSAGVGVGFTDRHWPLQVRPLRAQRRLPMQQARLRLLSHMVDTQWSTQLDRSPVTFTVTLRSRVMGPPQPRVTGPPQPRVTATDTEVITAAISSRKVVQLQSEPPLLLPPPRVLPPPKGVVDADIELDLPA